MIGTTHWSLYTILHLIHLRNQVLGMVWCDFAHTNLILSHCTHDSHNPASKWIHTYIFSTPLSLSLHIIIFHIVIDFVDFFFESVVIQHKKKYQQVRQEYRKRKWKFKNNYICKLSLLREKTLCQEQALCSCPRTCYGFAGNTRSCISPKTIACLPVES